MWEVSKNSIFFFFFFFFNILLFYGQTHLHQKHLQTKTFKVAAPKATNLTFIVYQIHFLTTLLNYITYLII